MASLTFTSYIKLIMEAEYYRRYLIEFTQRGKKMKQWAMDTGAGTTLYATIMMLI
jgi:hypothetical protein